MLSIPSQARVVVVGGGIAGCSTAYHLTKLGLRDVVLLEQGRLTCGTTWHAAGLVGQTRATRNATRMSRYGIELYATLEQRDRPRNRLDPLRVAERREDARAAETDEAADGAREELRHRVRVRFARGRRPDRADPAHRRSRRSGVDSRRRQGEPHRPHDVARQRRAHRRRDDHRGRRSHRRDDPRTVAWPACNGGAAKTAGRFDCEALVNCAGQWARAFGRCAGVNVPLYSAEHFYLVTGKIEGVTPKLPVIRDPDGFIYYKEEVGGLVMGGFEPVAKPWNVDPIPPRFEFQLLDEDWEQFETADAQRDPSHAVPGDRAGQDAAQRTGELHARRQLHPRRGARGRRLLRVRRIQFGRHRERRRRRQARSRSGSRTARRRLDLWDVDVRRFARSTRTACILPTAPSSRSDCTTRCAGRARSSLPSGRCAARRSTTG